MKKMSLLRSPRLTSTDVTTLAVCEEISDKDILAVALKKKGGDSSNEDEKEQSEAILSSSA